MKIDMKWIYVIMAVLVIFVFGMEISNRKKVSELRSKVEQLQKILDRSLVDEKEVPANMMLSFSEQKLCNKGAVPRVLMIDENKNFKYFDNYEIATEIDNKKQPDYVGRVNIENRKLRFYVKNKDKFELRYFGYIYDWDKVGLVKGIETREENFNSDYCDEGKK
ncbi:MAG: hypothetical protein EP319_18235 [Deltaproteobacteria bacterium]|nr:MAG: hypothetical protein EP319_18235 [Deltaproteobacteria bacterium]